MRGGARSRASLWSGPNLRGQLGFWPGPCHLPQLSPRLESFAGPGKGGVLTTHIPSRTGGGVTLGKSRGHREDADLQPSTWGGGRGTEPGRTPEQRGCISTPLTSWRGVGGGVRTDYTITVN